MLLFLVLLVVVRSDDYTFGKNIPLVEAGQYHGIMNGTYLSVMFSTLNVTSNEYTQAKVTANLSVTIYNGTSNTSFDFMTFSSNSTQSIAEYRCYQTSIDLAISNISNCSLPNCEACSSDCIASCFQKSIGVNQATCCCSSCTSSVYNITLL